MMRQSAPCAAEKIILSAQALPTIIQKIIHLMATETSRPPGIDLVTPRRAALYALRVIVSDEALRGLGQAPRYVTVFGAGQFALVEPLLEGIVQLLLTDPGDELTCTRLIEIIRIISHESQDIVDRSRGVIDNVLQGTTATAIGERFNLGDVEVLNLLGDFCNSNVLSEAHGIALQRVEAEQEAEQGRMANHPFGGNQTWWDGLRITELEEEWLTGQAEESPLTHVFICPISNGIMRSPCTLQVRGDLSHVYDEAELAQHLRASIARDNMTPPLDPISNQALEIQGDPPYTEAQIFGSARFNDPLQRMISNWVNIRLTHHRANNFQAPPQADDELD